MVTARRLGLLAVVLGAIACTRTEDVPEDPNTEAFSVLPVTNQTSILPAIEDSEGQPTICLGVIGYNTDLLWATATALLETEITDVANKWNALLAGNPLWKHQGTITPQYIAQKTACAMTNVSFNINVWANVADYEAAECVGIPVSSCCSHTAYWTHTMSLGPWNRDHTQNPLDETVILHEYGHLIGLGDTYRIPGMNDWKGEQPASVMNGLSPGQLADDDKLGLWATLRAIKTGERDCQGFGGDVQMTQNGFNAYMCDPNAKSVNTHAPPPPPVLPPPPPSGPIADATLRSHNTYVVSAIQLNCRSGAGTENPVVLRLNQGVQLAAQSGPLRVVYSTEGKPWLLVKPGGTNTTCYTSGSYEFINPVL
jgi:hypothetical protein